MKVNPLQAQHIQDMCQALRPIIGEQAGKLWQCYIYADEDSKEELAQTIELLLLSHLRRDVTNTTPVFIPPSQAEANGDIYVGDVVYNGKKRCSFGLKKSEMFQHFSCFSRSGGGKTNLGFLMLKSLAKEDVPFLVMEWKRNYRDLLQLAEFSNMKVYTIGRNIAPFRFNPLIPPKGMDPKSYLKKLLFVLAESFLLGPGALYLLQEAISYVYNEAGVYDGSVKRYPTFQDVLKWLDATSRNLRGRESLWMASCLRTVSSLCFGQMDSIINSTSNQDLGQLLNEQVIFEMDGLSHTDKIFFVQSILLWIHDFRIMQPQREELVHAIFLEEAHHILPRHAMNIGTESILDVIFRQIREYGEALLVFDQMPSEISKVCLANSYCTIAMNAKEEADIHTLSASMLLDESQKNILGEMEIGKAIVKLQGRVAKPFMIHIPLVPIKKGLITDDMLAVQMKPFAAANETKNTLADLSEDEMAFLTDIALLPDSGVAARYRRGNLSGRQGDRIKHQLLEKECIQEEEYISTKGRIKSLRLTDKGKAVCLESIEC